MTDDKELFHRVRDLFERAWELPAAERETFVWQQAGSDATLANEVLSKLGRSGDEHPRQIGSYKILELLGEGGMGTVYLAEQDKPLKRRVALKLIKLGMDSKAVVSRFEQERQALALMQHDGIAKVIDCGTSERGQPFFVMELVKGIPIDQFCDRQRLSLHDRLKLMQQVCAAVQHAHQKGVIHRDLKPGNVLVSDDGGRMQVKIIDFGLAKAMGQKLVEATLFTEPGQVVGTPEYMAPEQADPTNLDIDTRADIYSLGVMLYQLLVDDLPFPSRELRRAGMLEVQRILREVDPPKPSTKITRLGESATELARVRRLSLSAFRRALQTDLDWVVLKALEKERNRRYETASALAMDLQRFLDHEPLVAGPPSAAYRARKFLQRYRGRVTAAALVLATMAVGAVGTFRQYLRAEEKAASESEAKARYKQKVDEFERLAAVVRHARLLTSGLDLYPAWPNKVEELVQWLESARLLLQQRQQIQQAVADLDLRLAPLSSTASADLEHSDHTGGVESEQFLQGALRQLLAALVLFERDTVPDVERRLRWARVVRELQSRLCDGGFDWSDAMAAIGRSPRYAGVDVLLDPDVCLGLVPIGENPATGLWEFYDLASAWDGVSDPMSITVPHYGGGGRVDVSGADGIVFVLLPGGKAWVGASRTADSHNYDSEALPEEVPVHELWLAPFFMSKFEVTRAQWSRLTRESPFLQQENAVYCADPEPIGPTHPADGVSWYDADTWMRRHGMVLPTEAQWEYACRAGTESSRWTGGAIASLEGSENVLDETAVRYRPGWGVPAPFEDGFTGLAPVGRFRPNPFGLYDILGNVREWCSDEVDRLATSYEFPAEKGTGRRPAMQGPFRVVRGSSCTMSTVRSAYRERANPVERSNDCGLRPVRLLIGGSSR